MLKASPKKRISQRVRVAVNLWQIRLLQLLASVVAWYYNFDPILLTFKIKARFYSFKNAIDNYLLWTRGMNLFELPYEFLRYFIKNKTVCKTILLLGIAMLIFWKGLIHISLGCCLVIYCYVLVMTLWIGVSPLLKSGFERFESSDIVRALILDDHAYILEFHKDKIYNNQPVQLNWPLLGATKSYKLQDLAEIANSVRIKSLFTLEDTLRVKLQVFRKLSITLNEATTNRILSYLVLRDFNKWLTPEEMVQTKLFVVYVDDYRSALREVAVDSPSDTRLNRIINERLDTRTYLTASYKKYCDDGLLKKYLDRQKFDTKHSSEPYEEFDIENQIVPGKKSLEHRNFSERLLP